MLRASCRFWGRAVVIIRQLAAIVSPALAYVGDGLAGFDSDSALQLVLGTAAHESQFNALAQVGGGPALGFWQIEPTTWHDIETNFLPGNPGIARRLTSMLGGWPVREQQLATNLPFGAVVCRLVYWRSPEKLAAPGDVAGHARVWKAVYNTAAGKGTEAEFVADYGRFIGDALS